MGTCLTVFAEPETSTDTETEETEEEGEDNVATGNGGSTGNSSADIISTYINLAAGKSNFGGDAELSFTKDQLRFLGVYISNFFIPFGTELGQAKGDSDKTAEGINAALKNSLNFSDTYATMFTDELLGLARNSIKDLVFVGEYEDADGHKDRITPTKYKIGANYMNFLYTMLGQSSTLINSLEGGQLKQRLADGSLKKGYWGYNEGGTFIPMFDFYIKSGYGTTASQVAFYKCLESVDTSMGYGFNLVDLTKDEAKKLNPDSMSDENLFNLSILNMNMKVDCFGDILVCGGQHQFVAVPGAMNPYTWVTVDSAGNDILNPGEAYNMVNIPSMNLADSGKLLTSTGIAGANTSGGGNNTNGGNSNSKQAYPVIRTNHAEDGDDIDENALSQGVLDLLKNKKTYGNKNDKEDYKKIKKAIQYAFSYADSVPNNLNQYEVSISDNAISVMAPLGTLVTLNPNKLRDDYKFSDQSAHDKLVDHMNNFNNILYSTNYNKFLFMEDMEYVRERAKEDHTLGETNQSTDPNTGTTNVRLKTFIAKLENTLPSTYRQKRGSAEDSMDDSWIPNSPNKYSELLSKAKDVYKERYCKQNADTNEKTVWDTTYKLLTLPAGAGSDPVPAPSCLLDANVGSITMNDVIIFIDNLGDFNFDNSSTPITDYRAMNEINYLSNEEGSVTVNGEVKDEYTFETSDTFSAKFTDIVDGEISGVYVSEPLSVSLYVSYCMSSLYDNSESNKQETIGRLGYRMNSSNLPEIPNEPLNISSSVQSDLILTSIRDWLYYLLHPTEGLAYFRELITNKLNSFLIGWHNDMLGTHGVGQTLGTTRYRNTTGYVTTPDLSEIEWTNSLIQFYNDCIPFLLVVMIVTMVLAYVTGILPIQKSIFGVAIFALFLLIPVNLINGVVGVGNRISEKIYGEKFTYWALMQMESYASAIDEAAQGDPNATSGQGSYVNYLTTLYNKNSQVYTNQGNESIVMKWQAPKKMTSLMYASDESYQSLNSEGKEMMDMFLGTTMTGQSFIDDPESVYLYRSYVDISNYSRYVYRGIADDNTQPAKTDLTNDITSNWTDSLKDAIQSLGTDYTSYRTSGYTTANDKGDTVDSGIKITVPMSSAIINDALGKLGTVKSMGISDYVGISPLMFNIGIPAFNKPLDLKGELLAAAGDGEAKANFENELAPYTTEDIVGLMAYSLYSENVFFYFSWDLYDLGLQPSSATNTGYKDLLLGNDGAGFFYNKVGNGELKDFMDMKSLFTYIIPYLKQCNDLVREWDNVYGVFMYGGVPYEDGHWDDEAIKNNPEMQQKYWHNINVNRLYSMYTPWVDIMYECSYADGENISAMGNKYYVSDPINPATYPAERPMVFSETEMQDYGLGRGDLTKVERLILDCNRGMEERMYELLNYFNFSDVTLNTAAAMNCAFEFNSTFSENGMFTDNRNIYPQSFELSDFSYDAFLRFILSNTTGEAMNASGDFYANIVNNSSMTTILVMLLLDVISMYVLPAFKIFFLIAVFLSAILIIVCTAFRVDPEQKFIKKVVRGVVKPMLQFLIATVIFSYGVSLFMGTGNNAVTQSKNISINMGSPVTVMICIIAINLIILYVYFKIIKTVWDSIKHNAKMAVNFMGGVAGATMGMLGAKFASKASKATGGSGGSSGGGSKVSKEGTGVSSARAEQRGNNTDTAQYEEGASSTERQNDTKRNTINNPNEPNVSDDDRKKDLNKKTKDGISKFNHGTEEGKKDNNKDSGESRRSERARHSRDKNVNDLGNSSKGRNDK